MKSFNEYLEIIQEGKIQRMKVSHLIPGGHGLTDKQAEKMKKSEISSKYKKSDDGKYSFVINNVEQSEKKSPVDILKMALNYDLENTVNITIWDFTDDNFKTAMRSSKLSDIEKIQLGDRVYGAHDSSTGGQFHFNVRQIQ